MRYFIVTIQSRSVRIQEVKEELKTFDAIAVVDGEQFIYLIKKSRHSAAQGKDWRQSAYRDIQYHARNSGENVSFEEVHRNSTRKQKISEKQPPLFE